MIWATIATSAASLIGMFANKGSVQPAVSYSLPEQDKTAVYVTVIGAVVILIVIVLIIRKK